MGDGEQSEGQLWEAAMAASNFKVDNLTNVDPVAAPQTGTGYGINPFLYDVLGRQYRVGARLAF